MGSNGERVNSPINIMITANVHKHAEEENIFQRPFSTAWSCSAVALPTYAGTIMGGIRKPRATPNCHKHTLEEEEDGFVDFLRFQSLFTAFF